MIPYDDLVVALAAWRQRQGLPVTTALGAAVASRAAAPVAPAPRAASLTPRTAPPAQVHVVEADDSAVIEETRYDNEGDDFVLPLGSDDGDKRSDW
jgi:hypothetical protein